MMSKSPSRLKSSDFNLNYISYKLFDFITASNNDINKLIDKYCDSLDGNKPVTIKGYKSKIKKTLLLTGQKKVKKIRGMHALIAKELLSKMPSNVHKKKIFANLSPDQIIGKSISLQCDVLSQNTVKDYLQKTSSFLNWCVYMEYTDFNPFKNIRFKKELKKINLDRFALKDEHIECLFGMPEYTSKYPKLNYHFWLILLLRYQALRVNEACQLYNADVVKIDGVWCIRVDIIFEGQSVKNLNAMRVIPIADELIRLGFLEFVANQGERLFPELPLTDNGFGGNASKWGTNRRKKINFTKGYDFHSLRHNFINELKKFEVNESLVSAIVGHENDKITYQRYGKEYSPKRLLEIVNKIDTRFTKHINKYSV